MLPHIRNDGIRMGFAGRIRGPGVGVRLRLLLKVVTLFFCPPQPSRGRGRRISRDPPCPPGGGTLDPPHGGPGRTPPPPGLARIDKLRNLVRLGGYPRFRVCVFQEPERSCFREQAQASVPHTTKEPHPILSLSSSLSFFLWVGCWDMRHSTNHPLSCLFLAIF